MSGEASAGSGQPGFGREETPAPPHTRGGQEVGVRLPLAGTDIQEHLLLDLDM